MVLGSPERATALTGAAFKWILSGSLVVFKCYADYRDSVTKGGIASGPEKAKYLRNNKSKTKNNNGEYNWVSFKCGSCPDGCSHEVS